MLADLEVIKTLLKRQSQKPINSILSSKEYDLKDFTSSKPPPASPSSTLQLSEGDGAIFAPFQPEEYLVDFWNGGKQIPKCKEMDQPDENHILKLLTYLGSVPGFGNVIYLGSQMSYVPYLQLE